VTYEGGFAGADPAPKDDHPETSPPKREMCRTTSNWSNETPARFHRIR
jgi:hypothetical protein